MTEYMVLSSWALGVGSTLEGGEAPGGGGSTGCSKFMLSEMQER